MLAAVFACGHDAVVSHGSAASLQGLWEFQPPLVDVIAAAEAGRKIAGVRRRHVSPPPPREIHIHQGIPCTTPSRTIVDVAGIAKEALVSRTVEQAAVLGLLDVPEIDRILAGPRRRGSPCLRRVLEQWRRYSPKTRLRSRMEAKLLPLLSQRNIPIPECNETLVLGGESFEIDFLWRSQRLVVEADGAQFHETPLAQARDRHRDKVLESADYRVLRLSWGDLRDRPDATLTEIARLFIHPSAVPLPGDRS